MRIPVLGALMAFLVMGALVAAPAQAAVGNSISGQLRDVDGAPLETGDFTVEVQEEEDLDRGVYEIPAGESTYSFADLRDGRYTITVHDESGVYADASADGFIALSGGESRTVNFVIQRAGAAEVSLEGPDGGAFPAGESGQVTLYRYDPSAPGPQDWSSAGMRRISDGSAITFGGLTPGRYLARYQGSSYGAVSTAFDVVGGAAASATELSLEPLAVVRGTVRLPSGAKATAYADVSVELFSDVWSGSTYPPLKVTRTGTYSIKTIANEPVGVWVRGGWNGLADAFWDGSREGKPNRADAELFTVAPGATVVRDITLLRANASGVPLIEKTASPKITGRKRVGEVLSVSKGSWNVSDVTASYQWYRNGTKIAGADGPRYQLRINDRRAKVRARVIVRKPGYAAGVAYAAKVGPFAVAASRLTKKVKLLPSRRAAVVVEVNSGIAAKRLTGTITFRSGSKVLRSVKVKNGRVGFKVKGLKKGTHYYRLVYSGNKHVKASMRWVRLTVS